MTISTSQKDTPVPDEMQIGVRKSEEPPRSRNPKGRRPGSDGDAVPNPLLTASPVEGNTPCMIAKERNPEEHPEADKFSKAGSHSEEQLAFYLRRSFVDEPDVLVVNDLRLMDDKHDVAQVDHLILHRHGFVVIESKSVSTSVKVNKLGEWSRMWNGRYEGMPSPVQQAKRQIDFLRRVLIEYTEQLVGKMLGFVQKGFRNCPFEILVAVSDHATIVRDIEIPEVVKADQVPERILEIIKRHNRASSLFNLSPSTLNWNNMDGVYNFRDEEMQNIAKFLVEHHYPLKEEKRQAAKEQRTPVPETPPPVPQKPSPGGLGVCPKCGKQAVIIWGGHNYFWKCPACEKNFPLKEYCPTCRQKMMLRKDKNRYFIYCGLCKTPERLYCEFVAE